MPLDLTTTTSVTFARRDADLVVSWISTAPADSIFQVYIGRGLVWSGRASRCVIPYPSGRVDVEVGTVGPAEEFTDLSASLPTATGTGDRVRLDWEGGSYLDPAGALAGFRVYMSAVPGGPVGLEPVANLAAYGQAGVSDGFGVGGFGRGVFGSAPTSYRWESARLRNGVWTASVRPYDEAGNESPGTTATWTILAPPAPPARNAAGLRLTKSYNPATRIVILAWLPSPS